MEAKAMIAWGQRSKGERERDVANRHFALPRMRGWEQIKKHVNYLPVILCDVTYFLTELLTFLLPYLLPSFFTYLLT